MTTRLDTLRAIQSSAVDEAISHLLGVTINGQTYICAVVVLP